MGCFFSILSYIFTPLVPGPDKLSLVVSIAPELLKDLSDDNLLKTECLSELPILETTSYPFQMTTKTWQTVMNGHVVLNNEMKDQKYFFVQGDVPIFGQINWNCELENSSALELGLDSNNLTPILRHSLQKNYEDLQFQSENV